MPRCTNCDTHVTSRFARVFGDNQDAVHRCIHCVPNADLDEKHEPPAEEEEQTGLRTRIE